jgi:hypothetical protein
MGGSDEGGATILRFPVVRRETPSIEAVTALAPPRSMVDSLLAEAGLEAHDVARGFAREFDYLVRAIRVGGGPDDATVRLRHLLDTHLLHAMDLCQAFQATCDRLVKLEVRIARADMLGGPTQAALRQARREFRDRAIAARVATDAALGAAATLAAYVRSVAGLTAGADGAPEQLQLFAAVG